MRYTTNSTSSDDNNYKMTLYPIITDSFKITNEGTFRFVKNGPVTYWNHISQQCVEKLTDDNKWEKLNYEESSRIAKQFIILHNKYPLIYR